MMNMHEIADQVNAERLSALLDGELAKEELGLVLQAVEQDPQLKQLWRHMCLTQQKLARLGAHADIDMCDAVIAQLGESGQAPAKGADLVEFPAPAPSNASRRAASVPAKTSSRTKLAQFGMAAGIAAFGVVMWNLGGNAVSPASDAGLAPALADRSSVVSRVIDVQSVNETDKDWQAFETYWMVHSVQAGSMGSNVVSYGRVVDPQGTPKPVVVKVTR